jgi:hypothetical protein
VATTTNGEKRHRLSNRFNNGGWSHKYGFRPDSMHRLDAQTEDASAFPKLTQALPKSTQLLFVQRVYKYVLTEVGPDVPFRRSGRMKENPHHGSSQPFIFMG